KTLHSLVAGFRPASSIPTRWLAFLLLSLGTALMLVQPCAAAPFKFEETGSLAEERLWHTATLMSDGKVLVAGGTESVFGDDGISSAEFYDPATGTWASTGSLATNRAFHTATLLPNGMVLVTGGFSRLHSDIPGTVSAELYDPKSGTWKATGSLAHGRYFHTATLLPNGKV